MSNIRDTKHRMHPLLRLFGQKRIFWRHGMNLLQEGPIYLISDNCVEPEDVAECDANAVVERALRKNVNTVSVNLNHK